MKLLSWDMYEITAEQPLHGVMLRGRLRKLGMEKDITILCENASDADNTVRFALLAGEKADPVIEYIKTIIPDGRVTTVLQDVQNPVLSKLKVNRAERYQL